MRGPLKAVLLTAIIILSPAQVDNSWASVGVVKFGSGTRIEACTPSDTNSSCVPALLTQFEWQDSNGNCWQVTMNTSGMFVSSMVSCPNAINNQLQFLGQTLLFKGNVLIFTAHSSGNGGLFDDSGNVLYDDSGNPLFPG